MVSTSSSRTCVRFEPNRFKRSTCQHCFRARDDHSEEALEKAKMARKVLARAFLYVAPNNLDFSLPAHTGRRWQRRFFTLFDDGELTYALDNNPDTVPQVSMDMTRCIRVCEADPITGHSHSILLAFGPDCATPVCYVKADTTEEIRWWQNLLCMFAKQNTLHHVQPRRSLTPTQDKYEPTVIQVNEESLAGSSCTSAASSRCSSPEGEPATQEMLEQLESASKASVASNDIALHGSVRSVKMRQRYARDDGGIRRVTVDVAKKIEVPLEPPPPLPVLPVVSPTPAENLARRLTMPFHIDTAQTHTVRKGWLMLRGKNENEWLKHWVVLAGLSIKLYKDVWAEDSTEPQLIIDLSECENVYPSASAKNYGIELKCRRTRYVLSAMTPGIRDSWIAALQQKLHNPSPTFPGEVGVTGNGGDASSLADSSDIHPVRKKHIAYVAPESIHSSMMGSSDGSDNESNRHSRRPQRGTDSIDGGDRRSVTSRVSLSQQPSMSPTIRRSPVARLKEKSSSKTSSLRDASPDRSRHASSNSSTTSSHHKKKSSIASSTVQSLRDQLHETSMRLGETQNENDRLRGLYDANGLSALRKSLSAAEEDVARKQYEMAQLRQQLDSTPSLDSHEAQRCAQLLTTRMVSLLKVQVGALSKFLHSRQPGASEWMPTRKAVDDLIRSIAYLDEGSTKQETLETIEDLVERTASLYEDLGAKLRPAETSDQAVNTEAEDSEDDLLDDDLEEEERRLHEENLRREVADLKTLHSEELESLRTQYEQQLAGLRERLAHEEERRRRTHEELKELTSRHELSLSSMKESYEEALSEQRRDLETQIDALREAHEQELIDEKQATRLALDVLRRSHDEELKQMNEKLTAAPSADAQRESQRQGRMLEQMRDELTHLSALYSAKCVENAQLDERMAALLVDKENRARDSDSELQNRRLQRELRARDTQIEELRQKIAQLERKLAMADDNGVTEVPADGEQHSSEKPAPAERAASAVRFRRQQQKTSRRTDVRFHSNPVLSAATSAELLEEVRRSLAVPVAERRKFFETIAEYSTPF